MRVYLFSICARGVFNNIKIVVVVCLFVCWFLGWFVADDVRVCAVQRAPSLTVLPVRAKVPINKREAGEFVLVDASYDVVWHGRQDRFLFGKFGVEIQRVSRITLQNGR